MKDNWKVEYLSWEEAELLMKVLRNHGTEDAMNLHERIKQQFANQQALGIGDCAKAKEHAQLAQ